MLLAGTEEQKQKYIPKICSGEEFMAFGLTEPGAGSDAGAMTTKAVEDGDSYILNGRKCFITGAPFAKNTVIFAKTSGRDMGITSFLWILVYRRFPRQKEKWVYTVSRPALSYSYVRVPKRRSGEVDKGFITAMKRVHGRIGVPARLTSHSRDGLR
jgi:alkylation response protein AidB-like acyl-CoA dehydrogenase